MFKKLLQAVGVGGPSVDTVLHEAPCQPGGSLAGQVRVGGASAETHLEQIVVSLVAEVETADDDKSALEFQRVVVADDLRLEAEEYQTVPFSLPLPWQTPVMVVHGEALRGMRLGVRTEVSVARAVDASDMDPLAVEPLPSQQAVLDALLGLGAHVKSADVEHGHIHGVAQEFPFYQEIEFFPPPQFAGRIGEIELTFVARPEGLDVVLEADKRGGLFTPGGDALGRIHRSHEEALHTDWPAEISQWLDAVATGGHGIHGHASHGIHGHEHHEHHEEHRSGPGMGGMVAAGAGGLAVGALGGYAAAEMFDGDEEEQIEELEEEMEEMEEDMEEMGEE